MISSGATAAFVMSTPKWGVAPARSTRLVHIWCNRPDPLTPENVNDSFVELNGIEPSAS